MGWSERGRERGNRGLMRRVQRVGARGRIDVGRGWMKIFGERRRDMGS